MTKLVTSQAYTRRVLRAIQQAHSRVLVLSLIIQQDDDPGDIITALTRAAERGVMVHVIGDYATHSFADGHLNPYYGFRKQVQSARELATRLRSHNIRFDWIGGRSPFLFAGRTHSKWIIADDTVFSFGGINLHTDFMSDADYMIEITDPGLADILANEHEELMPADTLGTAHLSRSIISPYGEVLVDGGIVFDSIIYRRAVELVKSSDNVVMVTQYCPTGKLAAAIRSTKHQIYFNPPKTADLFTNWLIKGGEKLTGITNAYTHDPYIHAKFMIVTHPDGSKTAITGSHNFISYGGMLGTREIALQTSDPVIIGGLEQFYSKYIA